MTTAIKSDCRDEILRILREDLTFEVQPEDVNATIEPTAIVFQKVRAQKGRPFEASNQLTDVPGLLVCQPLRTPVPDSEGTNERDIWHYHWLVQLIDNDLWNDDDRIRTWDRWVEQIISLFMFHCLNGVVSLPRGQVRSTTATETQDIDENRWVRDSKFINGILLEVTVLQPRGIV